MKETHEQCKTKIDIDEFRSGTTIITHHPKSEVTDSCESSKNVPDDIEKDVTDDTGPKELMGGSEHSQNEFLHEKIDMNANDQSKQGPETEIVTKNPNGPESEGTDGGNVIRSSTMSVTTLILCQIIWKCII
jgi:hypothetical protein